MKPPPLASRFSLFASRFSVLPFLSLPTPAPLPPLSRTARSRLGRAAAVLAGAAVVVLLFVAVRGLDLSRVRDELVRARPGWLLVAVVCYLLILPLWAAQWWVLSPRTPRRTLVRMLGVVSMASAMMNTTWTLVGEATGLYLLDTQTGVDRPAALAVLTMDQLLVGVAKVVVIVAAALMLPLPDWLLQAARGLAVGTALLLAGVLAVTWGGARVHRWLEGVTPLRFADVAKRVTAGLAPLGIPALGGSALLLALLKKAAELLAIIAIQRAFGVSLPVSATLLVLAALSVASLVRVLPGNVGVFEAAAALAYIYVGMAAERAVGIAVVMHACFFFALSLPGYLWFVRVGAGVRS